MIIKLISCKVKEDQKAVFSQYQQEWQPISKIEGFLGQIGGWSVKDPLTACVFSFWENQAAYKYFMDEVHDQIVLRTGQERTYTSIEVDLFQEEFRISGSSPDIVSVLQEANFIRTALSHVKEERIHHFIDMQRKVWNPGMKKAEGMLGGEFARSQKNGQYFLVLTGWTNQKTHQKYMVEHFPDLKKTATPEQDVVELTGEQLMIEESWHIRPNLHTKSG
jgi:heme-degrading monooxygenase HmoA